MMKPKLLVAAVMLGSTSAVAQGSSIYSGFVVDVRSSQGAVEIDLDVAHACGSSTFIASQNQTVLDVTMAALARANQFDPGIVTFRVDGCEGDMAIIIGATGGPDMS